MYWRAKMRGKSLVSTLVRFAVAIFVIAALNLFLGGAFRDFSNAWVLVGHDLYTNHSHR